MIFFIICAKVSVLFKMFLGRVSILSSIKSAPRRLAIPERTVNFSKPASVATRKLMRKITTYIFCMSIVASLFSSSLCAEDYPQRAVVCVPVADLRRSRTALVPDYNGDPDQETQLLYGEHVIAREITDGWVKTETVHQREFTQNNSWQGYTGWMREEALMVVDEFPQNEYMVTSRFGVVHDRPAKRAKRLYKLSMGSRLIKSGKFKDWLKVTLWNGKTGWIRGKEVRHIDDKKMAEKVLRRHLVSSARTLAAGPYLWGGRSAHDSNLKFVATGVDCSGLVNLCFMANGILVPRDAHEQFILSQPVSTKLIKPGDLIFLADLEDSKRIVHVILYLGWGKILDVAGEKNEIKVVPFKKRFGRKIRDVKYGQLAKGKYVYYGSYVTPDKVAAPTH